MNQKTVISFLAAAVVIALTFYFGKGCSSDSVQTTIPMTDREILNILTSHLDSHYIQRMQAIETDMAQLDGMLELYHNEMSDGHRELIRRVQEAEKRLSADGLELRSLVRLNTETLSNIKIPAVRKDSIINGRRSKVAVSNFSDEWMNAYIIYDLELDSVIASLTLRNDFDISTATDEDGRTVLDIQNRNPHTYTLPGTSIFKLNKPAQSSPVKQPRLSLGIQAGVYSDIKGNVYPGAGIGIQYRLIPIRLKRASKSD